MCFSIDIVTRLHTGSVPNKGESFPQNANTGSAAYTGSYSLGKGENLPGVKMTVALS